jgi:hypothetical protein
VVPLSKGSFKDLLQNQRHEVRTQGETGVLWSVQQCAPAKLYPFWNTRFLFAKAGRQKWSN